MKVVLIHPEFNNSSFFEGNYIDLDDAFDEFVKKWDIAYDTFARQYGDWEVYTKANPHLEYQGTVAELLTVVY